MATQSTLKNHEQEKRLCRQRVLLIAGIALGCCLILFARLFYLQVIKHHFYSTLSKNNILTILPITPNRGLIYDRDGLLIAKNVPVYSLDLIPRLVKDIPKTVQALQKIIPISDDEITAFQNSLKHDTHKLPIPIKLKLTEQDIAKFYVTRYHFPGVIVAPHMLRDYPTGRVDVDALGYVSRISARELREHQDDNYNSSADIGQTGIERYYQNLLRGKPGAQEVETNARGHVVRTLSKRPPVAGDTLYLTIDTAVQRCAIKALGDHSGAVVAIQPSTGAILALVSKPSYNPNPFVMGISHKAYQKLLDNPRDPLYNRATRGQYAPGSTIKPFYALFALNRGIISKNTKIHDKGWFKLPNTHLIFHDWKRGGHGIVNVIKALTVSCDVFFYQLAVKMGIKKMDHLLRTFGFGESTGVDLPSALDGLVPTPAWKMATKGKHWFTGNTVNLGIGQGSLLVTPLQLAVAVATIAERGKQYKPHLLMKVVKPNGDVLHYQPTIQRILHFKPEVWKTVITGMKDVIMSPHGTAIRFGRRPGYTAAGKTGTAQVYGHHRNEEYVRTSLPRRLRSNSLFIEFAPIHNPKIAVATLIEHASGSDKVARKVTDCYFDQLKQREKAHASD